MVPLLPPLLLGVGVLGPAGCRNTPPHSVPAEGPQLALGSCHMWPHWPGPWLGTAWPHSCEPSRLLFQGV